MVKQELPTAHVVFSSIPLPAMAQDVEKLDKSGLHVFRLCKGKDIQNNPLYVVECRDIIGFATDFTEIYTDTFSSKKAAYALFDSGMISAEKEYKRLSKKLKERLNKNDDSEL